MKQKSMSEATGIYIFCSIPATEAHTFGSVTIDHQERATFTIHYRDAAIVAAAFPLKIYHPTKENVTAHQQVISKVMNEHDSVIPISFGNVFHSQQDVEMLLENLYPQFASLFPQLKGKIEVGLKVIGKADWLKQKVNQDSSLQQVRNPRSASADFYKQIAHGETAQKFFLKLQHDCKKELYQHLEPMAEASRLNPPIVETMLLNASFLINREKEAAFDERVNDLYEKWKHKADFKYSGPWAAYNFINIQLKVEENV